MKKDKDSIIDYRSPEYALYRLFSMLEYVVFERPLYFMAIDDKGGCSWGFTSENKKYHEEEGYKVVVLDIDDRIRELENRIDFHKNRLTDKEKLKNINSRLEDIENYKNQHDFAKTPYYSDLQKILHDSGIDWH